jgi:WD40 repeat protein
VYATGPGKIKIVKQLPRKEIAFAMARKPQSAHIYFGGSDFAVCELDLGNDKPESRELGRHESYVTGLALAGTALISGGYDGRLIWWDTGAGAAARSIRAHDKWIRRVVASPDGRVVASVADDMVCRLWDPATGQLIRELRGHEELTPHHFPSMLYACAFSPDGSYLATGDKVGHITIWERDTGSTLATLEAPVFYTWDPVQRRHSIGGIRALAFSPDGSTLAAGGIGRIGNIDHLEGKPRVELFDWRSGKRICELYGEGKGLVESIAFHPGGQWLLAAGGYSDGLFLFCDPAGKKVLSQEKVPMYVHDLTLGESGETIYAVGHHKIAVITIGS